MKIRRLSFVVWILSLAVLTSGCEAFVRKFTRKSKKDKTPQEEMVLAPEEYKPAPVTGEETYRKYLLYWKSWQDELIEALLANSNHKKQIDCAMEAIKNMEELKKLLREPAGKKMQAYIERMDSVLAAIENDPYGNNAAFLRSSVERVRRDVLRDLSYSEVKGDLV